MSRHCSCLVNDSCGAGATARPSTLRPCPRRPPVSATPAATSRSCARSGSSFSLCRRWKDDDRYPRYPRLPVLRCPGYEPRAEARRAMRRAAGGAVVLAIAVAAGRRRPGDERRRRRHRAGGGRPSAGARSRARRSRAPRSPPRGSATAPTSSAASRAPDGATSDVVERYDLRRNRWARVRRSRRPSTTRRRSPTPATSTSSAATPPAAGWPPRPPRSGATNPSPTAGRGCPTRRRRAPRSRPG